MPKKCGHMEGKQVVATGEMVERVHAAVEASRSEVFLIIARTDARVVEGLDGALERRYREAGADVLFVEAPRNEAEFAAVAEAFPDTPLPFNRAEGGKTPAIPFSRIKEQGFDLIIFPISTLLTATRSIREVLAQIRAEGTPIPVMDRLVAFGEFLDFIGLPEIRKLEERYTDEEVRTPG